MVTVVIAAHNEEAIIGRCLDALNEQTTSVQVIVSANGCTDRTAEVAAACGALVVDRKELGKAGALNAADRIATTYPRIYLDADIVVPPDAIDELTSALASCAQRLAVAPRRRIDTRGRPFTVKAYFAINERLPAFRHGLFGRGMIALSAAGRERFEEFPPLIADDLFIDSLFSDTEKQQVDTVEVTVAAPYRTRALLARLIRVRRGNAQMRAASQTGEIGAAVRPSDRWAWLRDVVLREPHLAPAAIPYLIMTMLAGLLARRSTSDWGRDSSTRSVRASASEQAAA